MTGVSGRGTDLWVRRAATDGCVRPREAEHGPGEVIVIVGVICELSLTSAEPVSDDVLSVLVKHVRPAATLL
ncbi:hypothetical protein Asi03nite_72700 [Actinoplanes siamensis]|uniref:Uncharacterized protein n=1 Tax=Actinoplanes siamensis TaxID=1223317 RepID=A0A919NED9_9ACTN|nr:hypothetical protein Asi03nite_72700 [Actinoplanes siamensis]